MGLQKIKVMEPGKRKTRVVNWRLRKEV